MMKTRANQPMTISSDCNPRAPLAATSSEGAEQNGAKGSLHPGMGIDVSEDVCHVHHPEHCHTANAQRSLVMMA